MKNSIDFYNVNSSHGIAIALFSNKALGFTVTYIYIDKESIQFSQCKPFYPNHFSQIKS